jgi:hypothetical protein
MAREKQKQITKKAKIVGLWGDPGLSEYHHFDILSRFLIVQIEPFRECVTRNRTSQMLHLVLRPKELWIQSQAGGNNKIRRDVWGNINEQNTNPPLDSSNGGLEHARFLAQNIQPITPSYKIGDEILISKIETPLNNGGYGTGKARNKNDTYDGVRVFSSDDSRITTPDAKMSLSYSLLEQSYNNAQIENYFNQSGMKYDCSFYFKAYHKILKTLAKKTVIGNLGANIAFTNTSNDGLITRLGGIASHIINFNAVSFIDANVDKRTRPNASSCVPVVVVNPSTFPTAAQRNIGGININF